jgi:hypothetical protein
MFSSKLPPIHVGEISQSNLEFVLKYTPAFQQKRKEISIAVEYYHKELDALPGNVELEVYKLPNEITNTVLQQLPLMLLEKEVPDVFFAKFVKGVSTDILLPHIDIGRRCGINIYIDSSPDQVTSFYNCNQSIEQLEVIETFVSNPGETWGLDTTVLHSVLMPDTSPRSFISLSFRKLKLKNLVEYF